MCDNVVWFAKQRLPVTPRVIKIKDDSEAYALESRVVRIKHAYRIFCCRLRAEKKT